jgi:hypothetical protein
VRQLDHVVPRESGVLEGDGGWGRLQEAIPSSGRAIGAIRPERDLRKIGGDQRGLSGVDEIPWPRVGDLQSLLLVRDVQTHDAAVWRSYVIGVLNDFSAALAFDATFSPFPKALAVVSRHVVH